MSWKPSKHRIHRTPSPTQLGVKWPFDPKQGIDQSLRPIHLSKTSSTKQHPWTGKGIGLTKYPAFFFQDFTAQNGHTGWTKWLHLQQTPTHPPNPWHNLRPSPRPTRECRAHCTVPYSSDPRTCRNPARNSQSFTLQQREKYGEYTLSSCPTSKWRP